MREMRLHGEEAAAAREVAGIDADGAEQLIGRVGEELEITALVDVAVVVDPICRHLPRSRRARAEQPTLPRSERRTGAGLLDAKGLEEANEHPVALLLELAHRPRACLLVRLG